MNRIKALFTTLLSTALVLVAIPASALIGTWSTAVNVSNLGERAEDVRLVVDSNGLVTAVWGEYAQAVSEDEIEFIYASTSLNGAAWSEPVLISDDSLECKDHKVAVDGNGLVVVVWECYTGDIDVVQSSKSLNGGDWSPVENLSDPDISSNDPAVTVDGDGLFTVVWDSDGGDESRNLQAKRFLNGDWSNEIEDVSVGDWNANPEVIVDDNGLVTAVWEIQDISGNWTLHSSTSLNGADWLDLKEVSDPAVSLSVPSLTVDSNGLVTVVWSKSVGDGSWIIQSSNSANGDDWSEIQDLSLAGQLGDDPVVAVDSNGLVTAAWEQDFSEGADTQVIQSTTSLNGDEWSEVQNISTEGLRSSNPQLTVDPSGLVTVVWEGDESAEVSDDTIQARTSLNGDDWSSIVHLSVTGGLVEELDADAPQVIANANGLVTAVWERDESRENNWDILQSSVLNAAAPTPTPTATPTLAKTGADLQWLLVAGLMAAVIGSGLLVASRRKRS
jgi:LPXTG-motif cell wall-anchored protein